MCEPVSLAMAAFSVGQAAVQHQQARVMAKTQTAVHKMNQAEALRAANEQYVAVGNRQQQEAQAAAESLFDRQLQATAMQSSMNAAAAENGVRGQTLDRLLANIMTQAGRDSARIRTNRDWALNQLDHEKRGIRSQMINRKMSTTKGVKPNGWATLFQMGAGVTNAAAYHHSLQG